MDNQPQVRDIIAMGELLWNKGLVSGFNGNISLKHESAGIFLTAGGTCLGRLLPGQIAHLGEDGVVLNAVAPSSETPLHLGIYQAFPEVFAVIHTHTPYINAYFLKNESFTPKTFEAEHVLGRVLGVEQYGINVRDTAPVLACLRQSRIVVLRRHGVVAAGGSLFECFSRIQVLEEQIKMEAISRLF